MATRHFGVGAAILLFSVSASAFVGRPEAGHVHVCHLQGRGPSAVGACDEGARRYALDTCILPDNLDLGRPFHRRRHSNVNARASATGTALFGRPKTTDEEMEQRKEQLRVLLSASKEKIDKLVRQNPNVIICSDIEKNHEPKLKLLQERLGTSKEAAGQLCLRGNRFLGTSLATLENRMDWLQARLNLNKSQLKSICVRDPKILTHSIEDNLEPTIDNIESILELSDTELTKIFVKSPDVLVHNMSAENIKQRLSLIQEILNLPEGDNEGIQKYVKPAPQILFWPEESMKESQQWIQQRLGLGDARIAQMCRNRPYLLFANTTTLDDKADSIQSELSLSDEELSNLVSKSPAILGYCPEENLRPKLQYLRTRFELDEDALKHLVLNAPSLFGYSETNIEEKLQFYSKLVGEREAKRLVIKSKGLLTKSLKTRLTPRLDEVEKSGVKVRWGEILIKRLATRNPDQWERYKLGEAKMGRRVD